MEISKDKNILIVGLGLMGGSFAKGMRNQGFHVCGFARRKEPIEFALANGIIDEDIQRSIQMLYPERIF